MHRRRQIKPRSHGWSTCSVAQHASIRLLFVRRSRAAPAAAELAPWSTVARELQRNRRLLTDQLAIADDVTTCGYCLMSRHPRRAISDRLPSDWTCCGCWLDKNNHFTTSCILSGIGQCGYHSARCLETTDVITSTAAAVAAAAAAARGST